MDYKNPDYLPIFEKRIDRLNRLRAVPKLLAAAKVYYASNPADFISDWMMTFDPRVKPSNIPFILWPKQREYIEWLHQRYKKKEDGLAEKSRDVGVTYLNMGFAIWLWLSQKGAKISFGSRKEKLVDEIGDPDSIFEKGRMLLRHLPVEFLPVGYSESRDATFMKLINRQNGSTITGESGDNIGRGGRSGLYFKDESAFYERPEKIEAALSQNSDVKIDVSTPNGEGNPFWKKRHGGKIDVFVFDWRDDPRKDDAWYQAQKEKLEPWILAQEVDRDYSASKQGVCIPAIYVRAAIELGLPTKGAVVAGLDVADEEGEDINVMIIRRGVKVLLINDWNGVDTTQTARMAINLCNEHLVDMMNYDSIGVGAGVRGEVKSLKEIHTSEGRRFPLVVPVNVGSTKMFDMYTQDKADSDMFVNIKASLWWRLRRRFERTYEHVNGIKDWPLDELISIPRHDELISELSRPLREINEAGKIRIEPKPKMKLRGLKSPNFADALVLSFANLGLIPVNAKMRGIPGEAAQITSYVTGKTKIPPGVLKNRPKGNRYVDFGDNQ